MICQHYEHPVRAWHGRVLSTRDGRATLTHASDTSSVHAAMASPVDKAGATMTAPTARRLPLHMHLMVEHIAGGRMLSLAVTTLPGARIEAIVLDHHGRVYGDAAAVVDNLGSGHWRVVLRITPRMRPGLHKVYVTAAMGDCGAEAERVFQIASSRP